MFLYLIVLLWYSQFGRSVVNDYMNQKFHRLEMFAIVIRDGGNLMFSGISFLLFVICQTSPNEY